MRPYHSPYSNNEEKKMLIFYSNRKLPWNYLTLKPPQIVKFGFLFLNKNILSKQSIWNKWSNWQILFKKDHWSILYCNSRIADVRLFNCQWTLLEKTPYQIMLLHLSNDGGWRPLSKILNIHLSYKNQPTHVCPLSVPGWAIRYSLNTIKFNST